MCTTRFNAHSLLFYLNGVRIHNFSVTATVDNVCTAIISTHINPLAPEFSLKFEHTLCIKCE